MQSPATGHLRLRLILLFALLAGVLSLLAYPYGSPFYLSLFLSRFSIFSFPPLVALDWLYSFSGRIPKRRSLLLFFAGIAATVGSALYSTTLVEAGPCTPGVRGAGFPLPWFLNFYTPYLGLLCPFPGPDTNVGTFPTIRVPLRRDLLHGLCHSRKRTLQMGQREKAATREQSP